MEASDISGAHQPAFAPDFRHYVFSASYQIVHSEADIRLFIANADGSDLHQLTSGPRDSSPQWSPDGQRIVFVRSTNFFSALFMVDVATGAEQQLTDFTNDIEPDWSPDGRRIVFTTSRDGFQELYTMAPDGSDLQRLTHNENLNDLRAQWSPDGTMIAYMTDYSVDDGTGEIWLMQADGSDPQRLTDDKLDDREPRWSPDGWKIVFTKTHADRDGTDLYVYDLASQSIQQLTGSPGYEYAAVWSPDSQWIGFTYGQESQYSLYAVRVDGSDLQPLLADEDYGAGYSFAWLP